MIEDRRLDIGFIRLPVDAELSSMAVGRDRLAFVYPAKMADQITDFDSKIVRELPLISLQIGTAPGTEAYIQRLLVSRHYEPKTIHRVNESLTQLTLVSAGLGYCLMHESALSRVIDYGGGVIVQPIEDPIASWDVGIVWRHEETNPAAAKFVSMARSRLGELSPSLARRE
jgi:DNA-binding transcriptional LysR family regulator